MIFPPPAIAAFVGSGSAQSTPKTKRGIAALSSQVKRVVKDNNEARIRAITDKTVEPGPDSLQENLDELRNLAVSCLTQLRELLANPSAIHEARALLAEQVGKITAERVHESGKITFKANGKIDFFGEEALTRLSGAGGPVRTERHIPFTIKVAA